jgi:hypothetical protein
MQKVSLLFKALSLLFTSPVLKMDKVELRTLMTVKATLAYGKNFHFYHEALDNNHVYLELEDVAYQAGYRRVMVAIPIDVWEVIRSLGAARLNLVNASDEELLSMVERVVEERMAGYERARASDPESVGWLRFSDAAVFGALDEPRGGSSSRRPAERRSRPSHRRASAKRRT